MPLSSINKNTWAANPWGKSGSGSIDGQRSDLWLFDLDQVIKGIQRLQSSNVLKSTKTIDAIQSRFFAKSVALPEMKIGSTAVKRANVPYLVPDYDEPTGPVKAVFRMDDGGGGLSGSKIYTILSSWRDLARTGREAYNGLVDPPMLDENYKATFKFSVTLSLLTGEAKAVGDTGIEADANFSESSKYILYKAWCQSIQLGEFDYDRGEYTVITAILQPEAIHASSDNVEST